MLILSQYRDTASKIAQIRHFLNVNLNYHIMKQTLLFTVLAMLAAACHVEEAAAYNEGFRQPGYVFYLGATETAKLEFIDPSLENEPNLTFSSSNEDVVSFNGLDMILKGAGEALITASYSAYQSFSVGVKVIDPKQDNDLYVRMKSGESLSDGDEGVIISKFNSTTSIYKYALLYKSSGTTASANQYDTFGDGEISFFCKSNATGWPNGAILTFNHNAGDNTYKITNEKGYLQPQPKQPNMQFGADGDNAKASIEFDDDNYVKICYGFGSWKNAKDYFITLNNTSSGSQIFKYAKISNTNLPIELYVKKSVKFEAPEASVMEACIDGNVKYGSDNENIKLSDGEHKLTFTVPEGVRLYYKFVSNGDSQQMSPMADTPEWTRYDAGTEIPVTSTSGSIEYYAESHGLQSSHVTKIFTIATGMSNLEIGNGSEETPVYFDLNGYRVNESAIMPGIYIKKTGHKTEKIVK